MTTSEALNIPLRHLDKKTRWTWVLFTGFLAACCAIVAIGRLYRKETERAEALQAKNIAAEELVKANKAKIIAAEELARTRAELLNHIEQEDKVIESLRETAEHGYMALDKEGKVTKWNPGMTVLTGKSKEEMLGHDLRGIMDEEAYQRHAAAYEPWIKAVETDQQTLRLECILINQKTGIRYKVFITARKVLIEGMEPYAVGLVDRRKDVLDLTKKGVADAAAKEQRSINRTEAQVGLEKNSAS